MKIFKKRKNLQPWCDYFKMLQEYVKHGYLEINTKEHEAYVTKPAIHAMTEGTDPQRQLRAMPKTVRRIHAYAAWLSQQGKVYMKQPFAVHVVNDSVPHYRLYTIVVSTKRPWWRLWIPSGYIDVIDYDDPSHEQE